MPDFNAIAAAIATGECFSYEAAHPVGGGCIHRAWCLEGGGRRYFVKTNGPAALPMFEAEADGLAALAAAGALLLPRVIAVGEAGGETFLALEHLELRSLDRAAGARLGHGLAELHRHGGDTFGWARDNFIGSTPQGNTTHGNWPLFFARERLRPQLALAATHGLERKLLHLGEDIAAEVAAFFIDYRPQPSLLHGDLWSGNAAALADGTPVLFDPAAYRGDREADLAMAELFGGFPESFYAAYREAWPLDEGYETRKTLYNLYHVLNHFNLFGASYLGQAKRMMERLRADLRG